MVFLNKVLIQFGLITCLLFLCGCTQSKTPEYLLLHPEEIQPLYDECVIRGDNISAKQSDECTSVQAIIPIFKLYVTQFITQPKEFGLAILQAQMRLAKSEQSLRELQKKDPYSPEIQSLRHVIELQNLEVQSRLAIFRLMVSQKN